MGEDFLFANTTRHAATGRGELLKFAPILAGVDMGTIYRSLQSLDADDHSMCLYASPLLNLYWKRLKPTRLGCGLCRCIPSIN